VGQIKQGRAIYVYELSKHILRTSLSVMCGYEKLSVCLSVCLSNTHRNRVETAKHIIRLFPPPGSQIILVFFT